MSYSNRNEIQSGHVIPDPSFFAQSIANSVLRAPLDPVSSKGTLLMDSESSGALSTEFDLLLFFCPSETHIFRVYIQHLPHLEAIFSEK
jgi:hypothetical protein